MSEYQYYDFYAIDRSLSREEIAKVRTYSSRVNPSARRAIFEYNYSDFRYDEEAVLLEHFDMMLYVSNFGGRRLMMKFPKDLVSYETLKEYDIDVAYDYIQEIKVSQKGSYVLIALHHSIEEGDWVEGEGMLDDMLPIRNQILNGDYRALMLGWLHLVNINPEITDNKTTPPIPPNLKELDYSLESFTNFWEIDLDLIAAASAYSQSEKLNSDEELLAQIPRLSNQEKDQYLAALLNNDTKGQYELRKRLRELHGGAVNPPQEDSKTIGAIKEEVAKQHKARLEKESLAAKVELEQKMDKIEKRQAAL